MPTDNEMFGELMVKYPLGFIVDPYFSVNAKTQITESFRVSKNEKLRTAHFRDPITTQQSLGFAFGWKENKDYFNAKIGMALKQIRADNYTSLTDDFKTKEIEKYKHETGVSIRLEGYFTFDKKNSYKPMIDMFANYEELDIWSITFENELQFQLLEYFGLIIKFNFIYNEKQCLRTQFKESMKLGAIINF